MVSKEILGKQVQSEHYFNDTYDVKGRFASYWHQINEVRRLGFQSILEIGVGNGFFGEYLRKGGYPVTSIDIDKQLHPSVVASVNRLPFSNESFDIAACFEVLEHLPYQEFSRNLQELRRVARKFVIISVPDACLVYPVSLRVPFVGDIRKLISVPISPNGSKFSKEHYWEIGKSGYPLKKIMNDINTEGFMLEKTYRVFEMPAHRFFVLRKIVKK